MGDGDTYSRFTGELIKSQLKWFREELQKNPSTAFHFWLA